MPPKKAKSRKMNLPGGGLFEGSVVSGQPSDGILTKKNGDILKMEMGVTVEAIRMSHPKEDMTFVGTVSPTSLPKTGKATYADGVHYSHYVNGLREGECFMPQEEDPKDTSLKGEFRGTMKEGRYWTGVLTHSPSGDVCTFTEGDGEGAWHVWDPRMVTIGPVHGVGSFKNGAPWTAVEYFDSTNKDALVSKQKWHEGELVETHCCNGGVSVPRGTDGAIFTFTDSTCPQRRLKFFLMSPLRITSSATATSATCPTLTTALGRDVSIPVNTETLQWLSDVYLQPARSVWELDLTRLEEEFGGGEEAARAGMKEVRTEPETADAITSPVPPAEQDATSPPPLPFCCSVCTKTAAEAKVLEILQCGKCKTARYCSAECQLEDWSRHKPECKAIRKTMKEQEAKKVAAAKASKGEADVDVEELHQVPTPEKGLLDRAEID